MRVARTVRRWLGAAALGAAAGCLHDSGTAPAVPQPVTLAPAQYGLFTGSQGGLAVSFPAADAGGAQYLVVGQLTTAVPDLFVGFDLVGATAGGALRAAPAPAARPASAAAGFHDAVRRLEARAARASAGRAPAPPRPARAAPSPGDVRVFGVCADATCGSLVAVTAKAQYVGLHAAIYVDTLAPAGGFAAADVQRFGAQVDSVLYPIDTTAFGAPSDIDANGVILIVLTPQVNVLTPTSQCQAPLVGYSLGADIAPSTRTLYNDAEVYYGWVADPAGAAGCRVPVATALAELAPSFTHELQHLISFNQHVLLRGGDVEAVWLNEGMSHLAEELVGRHYDSLAQDSAASDFLLPVLYDAFLYEETPAPVALVTVQSPPDLGNRGAAWLFVRYLADRFGGVTQRLEQTALRGDANVAGATGLPFPTLLGRWALALYVSDLPGFAPDTNLTFRNWAFRGEFLSLNQSYPQTFDRAFPLIPATAAAGPFELASALASGSGAYLVVTQPAAGPAFSVTFTVGSASYRTDPQLAVIRLR